MTRRTSALACSSRMPQNAGTSFWAMSSRSRPHHPVGGPLALQAVALCVLGGLLRGPLLLRLVRREPEPDAGHRAHHGSDRGEPPPRQLQQPGQEHADARRQRPRPWGRAVHEPGHHDDPADVPHPSAQEPVETQEPQHHQDAEPDQPRDPRPARERPEQQRRRGDGQPGCAAGRAGEAPPREGRTGRVRRRLRRVGDHGRPGRDCRRLRGRRDRKPRRRVGSRFHRRTRLPALGANARDHPAIPSATGVDPMEVQVRP